MSAVYRMLSSLAAYDAGATVTAPEYEYAARYVAERPCCRRVTRAQV
jgi:hypothetical protein